LAGLSIAMICNPQIPTNILIREANAEDADSVVRLIQQLGSESPITMDYVLTYLKGTNNKVLLAEREGKVEGLLSYSVRPDLYHAGNSVLIEELVVDEDCRNKGIGGALITALIERLKNLDCKEVCLAVMPDNETAIRFYRSHELVEEALFLEKHF
jgi:ribosomal protein S18 acetylase RimI-like enzyme